ncbi:MAG: nitrate transporter substrate-binding protein [Proteobacteria bacterium]|nr:nitrate transporter substrate-binding protein [Pseudomonadota bacterium]
MALIALLAPCLQANARDKITIVVTSIEKQIYLPAKLAERLGYLKETGLDIELLGEQPGVNPETQMLSGAAQGVIGFYDHTIDLQARGKLVQSVVQLSQAPGEVILVAKAAAKDINSAADFRGKTLGVTKLGASTDFLVQYLAAKAGVKKSEFTIVPVGAGSTFITAIEKGKIDAGMTTEPTISRLTSSGAASILIDLRTARSSEAVLGGVYPGACLYMPTAWVNSHKEQVQKIVNAFVKTLRYIQAHSAREIAEKMPEDYYASNKQMYIDALEVSKLTFTADGAMPENGPPTVLDVLKKFDKAVQRKSINLANTFTSEFVNAVK